MRGKHYAIGAALLTVGAAAMALTPQGQHVAGLDRMAYLLSQMPSPFSAPPDTRSSTAEIEASVIPAPKMPASTLLAVTPPVHNHTAQPLPESPVASTAPNDTPFVWQGSGDRGQSWTGTGGRVGTRNNAPTAPSFAPPGGGARQSLPNLPSFDHGKPAVSTPTAPASPKAPSLTSGGNDNNTSSTSKTASNTSHDGTSSPSGGGGFTGQDFIDPADFASYEAPEGGEQQTAAVTVDEPGALSILLVSALGLLVARRVVTKRGAV